MYGEDAGEDSPADGRAVVSPKENDDDPFRVGDEEDEEVVDERHQSHGSEESRQWEQARQVDSTQPKYGVAGAEFENVWGREE